jgi:predicted AAA+ superfamily ATPase
VNELRRIRDYENKPHEFVFWRERDNEVDVLVTKNNKVIWALECKSGSTDMRPATIKRFKEVFPDVPLQVISMLDERPRIVGGIPVLPVDAALAAYAAL